MIRRQVVRVAALSLVALAPLGCSTILGLHEIPDAASSVDSSMQGDTATQTEAAPTNDGTSGADGGAMMDTTSQADTGSQMDVAPVSDSSGDSTMEASDADAGQCATAQNGASCNSGAGVCFQQSCCRYCILDDDASSPTTLDNCCMK